MAERIGFINFTAFDLRRAQEFAGIKTRLYDSSRPARSYFEIHPPLPPWKQLSTLGIEPMVRHTPPELRPLMNEYWSYFESKAIQHEHYLRWWRRHHAWNREEEIFLLRFEDLRNHLAEIYNRETYAQLGRMQAIFKKAAEKSWEREEVNAVIADREHGESHRVTNHGLKKKAQQLQLVHHEQLVQPDNKRLLQRAEESARITGEQATRELLHTPHKEPPRWARLLAVADYAQKMQMPIAELSQRSFAEINRPPAMDLPPTLKIGKI